MLQINFCVFCLTWIQFAEIYFGHYQLSSLYKVQQLFVLCLIFLQFIIDYSHTAFKKEIQNQ